MTGEPATPSAAYRMLSIPDALDLVLSETHPLDPIEVPFQQAIRHTLAEDVRSPEPVPGFRASIKDGYAVIASDGPGEYPIAFDVHAGSAPASLSPGSITYIATGGPVPEGADAVVQIEDTIFLGANDDGTTPQEGEAAASPPGRRPIAESSTTNPRWVKILRKVEPGHDIRPIGSDMAVGETVLSSGTFIQAPEIGILATVGATKVKVRRAPRVAVLSTGDEVCDPGRVEPLAPGQVRDANRAMLLAAAGEAGAEVTDLGIARDSAELVEAALDAAIAAGADILLTTGGVSMGAKDFIKPLLERRGQIFFGKVRMKPGKPLTFAKVPIYSNKITNRTTSSSEEPARHLLVFGLPGNPVSSVVTFHLVVVPCLRKMAGWDNPHLRRVYVRTEFPIKMDPERPEYHRAIARWAPYTALQAQQDHNSEEGSSGGKILEPLHGELVAESTGGQISSRLLSLRSANVLLEVPQAKGVISAGSRLSALVIGDLGAMPVKEAAGITTLKPHL